MNPLGDRFRGKRTRLKHTFSYTQKHMMKQQKHILLPFSLFRTPSVWGDPFGFLLLTLSSMDLFCLDDSYHSLSLKPFTYEPSLVPLIHLNLLHKHSLGRHRVPSHHRVLSQVVEF